MKMKKQNKQTKGGNKVRMMENEKENKTLLPTYLHT